MQIEMTKITAGGREHIETPTIVEASAYDAQVRCVRSARRGAT